MKSKLLFVVTLLCAITLALPCFAEKETMTVETAINSWMPAMGNVPEAETEDDIFLGQECVLRIALTYLADKMPNSQNTDLLYTGLTAGECDGKNWILTFDTSNGEVTVTIAAGSGELVEYTGYEETPKNETILTAEAVVNMWKGKIGTTDDGKKLLQCCDTDHKATNGEKCLTSDVLLRQLLTYVWKPEVSYDFNMLAESELSVSMKDSTVEISVAAEENGWFFIFSMITGDKVITSDGAPVNG